jgi:hypothetical protein
MSATPTSAEPPDRNLVTTAFLLGWSISEILGLVRKGVRPSAQKDTSAADYAPRLDASNGLVEAATVDLVFFAERIVQFYRQLDFETGERLSPRTLEVNALPEKARAWLDGKSQEFYSQGALRELFEDWTLQVWARLDAASADSARAFTAGMSLADTYWYLRLPARRKAVEGSRRLSEEDWRRLLSKYRLDVARSRLHTLQEHFPRYVIPVIRNHLDMWSIGTEVAEHDGRLVRIPGGKVTRSIRPEDEAAIQRALERQVQNWEAMLFGLREAQTFLLARDRRLIGWGRRVGLFFAQLGTALFLLIAAAVPAYFLSITLLPAFLQFFTGRNPGVSDVLALLSLFWTVLIALPVPLVLRAAYIFTRNAQAWLDDYFTIYFITRRTYIPWDKYLKTQNPKEQMEKAQTPKDETGKSQTTGP